MSASPTRAVFAVLLSAAAQPDRELAPDVALLERLTAVNEIHIRVPSQRVDAVRELAGDHGWNKVVTIDEAAAARDVLVHGVLTRTASHARDDDLVLVADTERRPLSESTVSSCLSVASEQGAAISVTRIDGDVILTDHVGRVVALPGQGGTFVADGLTVARWRPMFDLYDWAVTVAGDAIGSPHRWSLRQLGAVAVMSDDAVVRGA